MFFERRRKNNNQPVRQWLGVVVGIAIALLLTLPLPLPYCVASFCHHSVQLRYASCNVHIMSLQWRLRCALCRGIFWFAMQRNAMMMFLGTWRCFLFRSKDESGTTRRAAALRFMSQHFHATALFFVLRWFASCRGVLFVPRHCDSCRSIESGIARRVTAAPHVY